MGSERAISSGELSCLVLEYLTSEGFTQTVNQVRTRALKRKPQTRRYIVARIA